MLCGHAGPCGDPPPAAVLHDAAAWAIQVDRIAVALTTLGRSIAEYADGTPGEGEVVTGEVAAAHELYAPLQSAELVPPGRTIPARQIADALAAHGYLIVRGARRG